MEQRKYILINQFWDELHMRTNEILLKPTEYTIVNSALCYDKPTGVQ